MKSAFVFDMGGVIKKNFDYGKLLQYSKLDLSYNEFRNIFLNSIYDVQTGKINEDDFFIKFINDTKLNLTLDEFKDIYAKSFNDIYDDALYVLNKLKKLDKNIYLYSYLKPIDFKLLKKILDISIFKKTYLSYELGFDKTTDESFEFLVKDLNIPKDKIYFFDNEEKNIEAAKKVGINAILTTGETIKEIFDINDLYSK